MSYIKEHFAKILDSYFGAKVSLSHEHIKSFNDFLETGLPNIVLNPVPDRVIRISGKDKKENTITMMLEFLDVIYEPPSCNEPGGTSTALFPQMCRVYNTTYTANVYATYHFKVEMIESGTQIPKLIIDLENPEQKILIGKIPIMVRSKLCTLNSPKSKEDLLALNEDYKDPGGYFIVKGKEYNIIAHENKNQIIFRNIDDINGKKVYTVWSQSKTDNNHEIPYYFTVRRLPNGNIDFNISISKGSKTYLPLKVLFLALGIPTDLEIFKKCSPYHYTDESDPILEAGLTLPYYKKIKHRKGNRKEEKILIEAKTQKDALKLIGETFRWTSYYGKAQTDDENIAFAENIVLSQQFLPHIGKGKDKFDKIVYASHMVRLLLLLTIGVIDEVDRDDFSNKLIYMSGELYGQLFKHCYSIAIQELTKSLRKEIETFDKNIQYDAILKMIMSEKAMDKIARQISTGEWPSSTDKDHPKKGISQFMERKCTENDLIDKQSEVILPVTEQKTSTVEIHKAHPTSLCYLDPNDTPDGKKVGIINHMSFMTEVATYVNPVTILNVLKNMKNVKPVDEKVMDNPDQGVKIFVNEVWKYVANEEDINMIAKDLREKRRMRIINMYTSIYVDYRLFEIKISTLGGRPARPLYIVEKGKIKMPESFTKDKHTWDEYIEQGYIEYLTPVEIQYNCYIAEDANCITWQTTHCEIDKAVMFSLSTATMPNAQTNQGPRLPLATQQLKSAITKPTNNFDKRWDKSILNQPATQRPITDTKITKHLGFERPGCNIKIVFTTGTTIQEDACMLNRKIHRTHCFDVINYKCYTYIVSSGKEQIKKPIPKETKNVKQPELYHAIDERGHPIVGSIVKKGDMLLGKVGVIKGIDKSKTDRMNYTDKSEAYKDTLDGVIVDYNIIEAEKKIVKIKIGIIRPVTCGDKFCSRHAQKAIVSYFQREENAMFNTKGETPTIFFNVCGIPSRMTVGHMIDTVCSTLGLHHMEFQDGTSFITSNVTEELLKKLKYLSLEELCSEVMYDPYTGEKIQNRVFSGYIFYERLKHMVADKMFASSDTIKSKKDKDPIKGKNGGGALKSGYMEFKALLSHGAMSVVKEMEYDKSDKFELFVDEETGLTTVGNPRKHSYKGRKLARIHVPWSTKMLDYYLQCVGIVMRYNLEGEYI